MKAVLLKQFLASVCGPSSHIPCLLGAGRASVVASCHRGRVPYILATHTAVTSPTNPGRYYRPAGNIPAGGRERYLDCFIIGGPHGPACGNIPAPFGNVTGWREYYRRLGTSPAGGDIPGLWRGYSRLARGYSRPGGGISPPLRVVGGAACPRVYTRLTHINSIYLFTRRRGANTAPTQMGRPTHEAPTREYTHKHTQTQTNAQRGPTKYGAGSRRGSSPSERAVVERVLKP